MSKDFGQLPRVNPRENIVHTAKMQLASTVLDISGVLTTAELVYLLSEQISAISHQAIRQERDPQE